MRSVAPVTAVTAIADANTGPYDVRGRHKSRTANTSACRMTTNNHGLSGL